MKIVFIFLILLAAFVAGATARNSIKVPNGKAVLVDGKCQPEEWKDAAETPIPQNYELFFKKSGEFVYICVSAPQETFLTADLYLSPATDGRLYTLHASAKLGERVLQEGKWKDWATDFNWWNADNWWANTVKPDSFEKRSFLPSRAIEFQISRRRFSGKSWRVMFDIISGKLIFPSDANNLKRETWLELKLNR